MSISTVLPSPVSRAEPDRDTGGTVCVVSDDLLAADGVLAHLKHVPWLLRLPPQQAPEADVIVLVAGELTQQLLQRLTDMRRHTVRGHQRVVLITDVADETLVARALDQGVARILRRAEAGGAAITSAVVACRDGHSGRPVPASTAPGFEYIEPAAEGANALSQREIAIVRLLAAGLSTAEVATRLAYSERTIKSTVAKLLDRLGLRNRNQAIAHAYRVGAI